MSEDTRPEASRDARRDDTEAEAESVVGSDPAVELSSPSGSGTTPETAPWDDQSLPPTPVGAAEVFGDRLELAVRYVEILSTAGLERGLMGPRERPRLWDRHVLNSTAASGSLGDGESVVDIGSGAGLPGIPLALARPDLRVTLVEPLLRRVTFLEEVVEELELNVHILRGRAEESDVIEQAGDADVVISRAVAPLAKLAGWSAPLLRPGGRMIALKGLSAGDEVERDAKALRKLGFEDVRVEIVSAPDAEETRLVIATLGTRMGSRGSRSSAGKRRRR
ncbi:16S rRNA (guanine(527)-N(7))-methyltransferase RsmG [Rhodococcus sp. IEGM 1408]|uniref:16S rRNA (guanine(527)-N(7))-methyltransferase RsmG n=1 Tax=Rhodococcus sp. IEGM 1408 TaxID=3082220 RepID=UPI0029555920|nr:16S rRNA (guanine(527)-N(7))-methyltransferase RsmG [Rhodococcus sp. IEGM 1408]MDV8000097.1 16S rRNA (guanine(527)-N(7))-methyltransferase RsmG [Rhodococcus sp. IEGM 1408]